MSSLRKSRDRVVPHQNRAKLRALCFAAVAAALVNIDICPRLPHSENVCVCVGAGGREYTVLDSLGYVSGAHPY